MNEDNKKKLEKNQKSVRSKSSNKKVETSKKENLSENHEILDDFELLKDSPPELKAIISRSMMGSFSSNNSPKLTAEHIDKILDISAKDDERRFEDTKHSRNFTLILVLISVAFFVFLTLFLVGKDPELFKEIVKLLVAFIGGMGAGVGLKSYKEKK